MDNYGLNFVIWFFCLPLICIIGYVLILIFSNSLILTPHLRNFNFLMVPVRNKNL